jgi:hypothetical protein
MGNRRLLFSTAAALAAGPLMGMSPLLGASSALAAACTTGTVASYEALGATGCSVGSVTFSDISVTTTGSVTLTDFKPFTLGNESGLELVYTASSTSSAAPADVTWTYDASDAPGTLDDAFASLTGTVTGGGHATLGEQLDSTTTPPTTVASISLTAPNTSQTVTFAPISTVFVTKDQDDFVAAGTTGSSETSVLVNAFSQTTAIPEPSTWAMMLLGFAGLGYAGFRTRRTSVSIV